MFSAARLQRFISKAAGNTQPACTHVRAIRFAALRSAAR